MCSVFMFDTRTSHKQYCDTVPLKGKLTVPRSSKLDSRSSILENFEDRVEFRDVRGRSRIYQVEFRDFRVWKTKDFSRD